MAAKKVKAPEVTGAVALKLRTRLNQNQAVFWNRLGVTQSGGSRYEGGRPIPKPVKILFYLTYMATPGVISGKESDALDALRTFHKIATP